MPTAPTQTADRVYATPEQEAAALKRHYATPEQEAAALKRHYATPEQEAAALKRHYAMPEQEAAALGGGLSCAAEIRSITIAGSASLLGATIIPLSPNCWLLESSAGFAIAVMVSDTRVEVRGATGLSMIDLEGMAPADALAAIGDGTADAGPSINCGPNEQLCTCFVPAAAACSGIAITSYKCCPDSMLCSCFAIYSSMPTNCTLGVKVTCLPIIVPGDTP